MTNSGYKELLLCGLVLLMPGLAAGQQAAEQIVIVKSSDNNYFNQSIETLIDNVERAIKFKVVTAQDLSDGFEIEQEQRIFIALGQAAAESVSRLGNGVSTFNAYLTREQAQNLELGNQVSVLLDQPLRRYLAFCKLMLMPNSVGIIDQQEIILDQTQSGLLQELDFNLNQYQLDPLNKLLPVLRRLLSQNDALLMLPRHSIYNRDTLKGVLLTSYRNRKPVISYSPAHVKSGALASIYSSPADIGRHLAALVNQTLQNPAHRGPAFQFARFYSISVNQRVARALGIVVPGERDLRAELDRLEP